MDWKDNLAQNGAFAALGASLAAAVTGGFKLLLKQTKTPKDAMEEKRDSLEAAFRIIGRLEAEVTRLTEISAKQADKIAEQEELIAELQGTLHAIQKLHESCESKLAAMQQSLIAETDATKESVMRFLKIAEQIVSNQEEERTGE